MLSACTAFAGWRPLGSLTGTTTQDVVITDAGVVVATSSGSGQAIAWLLDGGILAQLPTGNYVGAGIFENSGSTCLVGLENSRALRFSSPACGTEGPISVGSAPSRFRVTGPGGLRLIGTLSSFASMYSSPGLTGTVTVTGSNWLAPNRQAMGTAHLGGNDYSVFNHLQSKLVWCLDDGPPQIASTGFAAADVVPFALGGAPAAIAAAIDGGLMLVPDVRDGGSRAVSLPPGESAQYTAFANEDRRGYGLVTSATGAVMSPVPDPTHVAETWVVRAGAPVLAGRVFCNGSNWCAGFAPTGVVMLLENVAAPTLGLVAPTITVGTPIQFDADAGDGDGDPVFLTWDAGPNVTVTPIGATAASASVTATVALCTESNPALSVTAWDGLEGHETTQVVPLQVAQGALSIDPPAATVQAGSGPLTLTASIDGLCPLRVTGWSTGLGPYASTQFTPPRNVCSANGLGQTVTVLANGQSASANVQVLPWGPPETPVFPAPARQDAGSSVLWTPGALHVCAGATGFPGTSLLWSLDAGGTGATLTPTNGGLLVVASDACRSGWVTATARAVVNGPSEASDAGLLQVELLADVPPLTAATPVSLQITSASGATPAEGTLTVLASCLTDRLLGSTIVVTARDGGTVTSGTFGGVTWSLELPAACDPAYLATAVLREDGGLTGAVAQTSLRGPSSAQAITAATPFTMNLTIDGGLVGGRFNVQTNCLAERDLEARVDLTHLDGGVLTSGTFALPGNWVLAVPPACEPRLVAVATLLEAGGATAAQERVPFIGPSSATPISVGTPFSMNLTFDAQRARVAGTLVVGTDCLQERGLTATVELAGPDGGVVATQTFAVPGPWAMDVPGGCSADTFVAHATLLEQGRPVGPVDQQQFRSNDLPISAGDLLPQSVEVSCGVGAHATLTLESKEGSCTVGAVTWTQLDGPRLVTVAQQGRSLEFQTNETDFSLIGRTLRFSILVDAGGGNQTTVTREVSLGGPRFVDVVAKLTPLLPTSEEPVSAELLVTNTSACAVDALELNTATLGLSPHPAGATVNGQPVTATLQEGALRLGPFSLGTHGTAVVRFSATPRLLGRGHLEASASVRGVPVSLIGGPAPASGCGCGATEGPAWLALLALYGLRMRRRELAVR